ncbi:hypothetical protein QBZ16_000488 [Prototheca wickerhamii]|uniref:Uncharacterized protein n=1 Tax=Prototheca wickerhamii TaxID=3111 RepID=A0AAD9ING7_PROWI|nr:hypothetical protein QBZ16_000488 [Prototheca wickerhamii]
MKHYGLFLLLIAVAGAALAASDDDPLDKIEHRVDDLLKVINSEGGGFQDKCGVDRQGWWDGHQWHEGYWNGHAWVKAWWDGHRWIQGIRVYKYLPALRPSSGKGKSYGQAGSFLHKGRRYDGYSDGQQWMPGHYDGCVWVPSWWDGEKWVPGLPMDW